MEIITSPGSNGLIPVFSDLQKSRQYFISNYGRLHLNHGGLNIKNDTLKNDTVLQPLRHRQ